MLPVKTIDTHATLAATVVLLGVPNDHDPGHVLEFDLPMTAPGRPTR
jgi:hypothetical protein